MLYRTAAIAGLVGLCVSARCVGASDADANAHADNNDNNAKKRKRFGQKGIFGKVFGGNDADDGAILAEDEGYWERFLQQSTSVVTPAPTVPKVDCLTSVGITCVNSAGADCASTPPPQNPEECIEPFKYTFAVENIGPVCMTLTSWVATYSVTVDGQTTTTPFDLLPTVPVDDREICPGETLAVMDTVDTDLCSGSKYAFTTNVEANPPNGNACEAEDMYMVQFDAQTPEPTPVPTPLPTLEPTPEPSPLPTLEPTPEPTPLPTLEPTPEPTISEECDVVVSTDCSTQAATIGGSGECDAIIPIITRCDQRATFMEMLFNGGNCDQSFNIQEADIFDCEDRNGGPGLTGQYYIHVAPRKSPNEDVYFSGLGNVGDVFPMCPGFPSCSGERFEADTTVWVFPPEVASEPNFDPITNPNYVQLVNYHTSCSQNLFLKDKFGSTQLVIFFNDDQGLASCFITATFSITLTNEGEVAADEIILFTNTVNGNTTDLTSAVGEVQPGEIIIITTQLLIDMTVRQDYIVTTDFVGATSRGKECSDSFTFLFTAGNNLLAPPGIIAPGSF